MGEITTEIIAGLRCQILRPERAMAGAPLVLIHGLGGGTWSWENFQRAAAARGRASYALELPLHRPGVPPDPLLGRYGVETYALHCAAALAEIGDCFVVGHSMGGLIAQKLAQAFNRRGYVLLASAPPWHMMRPPYGALWRYAFLHPFGDLLRPLRRRTMMMDRGMSRNLVNNRIPPEQLEMVESHEMPDSGRASVQMAFGMVKVDPRRVTSPCLVMGGLADLLIPASEQRRLAEFYHAPLRLFDRAHMLIIEPGWEAVAASALDWMAEIEGGIRPARTPASTARQLVVGSER
ncbi:MAG: alpha/beta hydrolase [Terriglobales bacterium]